MSAKKTGPICGNPLSGLASRECIEVTKVLDGCMTRVADLTFTAPIDSSAPYPYTFIRAVSSGTTRIDNVAVFPIEGRLSRISFDSQIPVTVFFLDANGKEQIAKTFMNVHKEVTLRLPRDSLTPYEIRVTSSMVSLYGEFLSPTLVSVRCCVMQISKVTAQVDILVPSYGYCEYPICDDNGNGCEAELPLFPPFG